MQSYLKTKSVWIQLFLFLGLAAASLLILGSTGILAASAVTGIKLDEIDQYIDPKILNPPLLAFMRVTQLIQSLSLFIIPAFLFTGLLGKRPADYLGLKLPKKFSYWILGIAAMLIAIPLVEYTGLLNRNLKIDQSLSSWIQRMEEKAVSQIQFMLHEHSTSNLILNIIFIALLAGVGEELFFRGILQRLLIKGFKSPWLGIIAAAFLFSFFHFQFFGFLPRLMLGILLGAVYWYSGSLWTAILAHFFYDAFFIVLAYFQPQLVESAEATMFPASQIALLALASSALVVLIVWLMKKNSTVTYHEVYKNDRPPEQDFTF